MLPEWVINYVGGGILILIIYIIISNTFWLLLGSKVLQSLPGVNSQGALSTFRIAIMILMSMVGFLTWIMRWPFSQAGVISTISLADCMSVKIQTAGRIYFKLTNRIKK